MTTRQRHLLKQFVRSGEMWDTFCQLLEDRATNALKMHDEIVWSSTEPIDLAQVIKLTAERQVCMDIPRMIQEEANAVQRQAEPEENPE